MLPFQDHTDVLRNGTQFENIFYFPFLVDDEGNVTVKRVAG